MSPAPCPHARRRWVAVGAARLVAAGLSAGLSAGLAAGCARPSPPEPVPARPTPPASGPAAPAPPAPTVDRARALAALAGDHTVIEPDGQPARWQISGGELVRRRGARAEQGWIEVPEPSRLIVRLGQGRAWFLGFAYDQGRDQRLWLGPGPAGQRQADGSWVIADRGLVVAAPEAGCRWYAPRLPTGYREPAPVPCAFTPGQLRYTLPRRSREGPAAPQVLTLVGEAAVGAGLTLVKPTPAPPSAPAN